MGQAGENKEDWTRKISEALLTEVGLIMHLHFCDEGGEVISRRVIGVGTIRAAQDRTFSVRVEVSSYDRPAA